MRRILLALALSLAVCMPALASVFDHFTGASAPTGWTTLAGGNGVVCMNGTIVAGSGGSCPGAVGGESFFNAVAAVAADSAMAYRTSPISLTTSKIFWFYVRNTASAPSYVYLVEGTPVLDTNANVFGGTGKALMRIAIGQNAGVNVGIDRYDTTRTRTQWNTGTSAWAAPTVNATTTTTTTYQYVGLQIDGPNRRWRAMVVGQTGAGSGPSTGLSLEALSDWVNFSFHEGGATYCNPTCGSVYLAVGEPLTDATATTQYLESYAEDDGTAVDMWLNGRDAGGAWKIYKYYAYPDVNGVPARFVPFDRTTVAVDVGGAAAWDEGHVKDPYVLKDGATYYMMYSGADAGGVFQLGCASAASVDGPWTKCTGNPMVVRSAGTDHDQVFNPVLVKDEGEPDANKRWKMIYVGADTSAPIRFYAFVRTCAQPPTHASCDTAAEWSAATKIWDVGGVGAIDEIGSGRVLPIRAGGANYLFAGIRALSGGAAQNRQETYGTTSDRWLSAVTKSGVITNASASSNCNTTLSGAVTNSRTFNVASITGCNPDDIVVADDDATTGNFHVNRILRASGSTLTMYHEESGLAINGRVRSPSAFWQIDVGPILSYSGGFVKYATCFDPMAGGGSTFSAYAEQTCTWTSSSVLGPWTLYSMGTPTAPLSTFARDSSNENPSLVNLPIPMSGGGGGLPTIPDTFPPRTFPASY